MKAKLLFTGILFFCFTAITFAQTTPVVNAKQKTQKVRIVNGVKTGELTRRETRRLAKQQARIKRTERRAKVDGKVTAKERRELRRKQRRASANIHYKKNNAIDRN